MKATLEFNLDDADDRKSHMRAIKATAAYLALYDMSNEIRRRGDLGTADHGVWNRINRDFHAILANNGIDLDSELD